MFRVARYRFRTTFRHRRSGLLTIAVLLALIGGLGIGALAGARRTQSSFPSFLAGTNPSDLTLEAFGVNTGGNAVGVYGNTSPSVLRAIAHLPHVERAETQTILLAGPLEPNGAPVLADLGANFEALGSVNGLGYDEDRVTVIHGRMADPKRAGELVLSSGAARALHLRVGETLPVGAFTGAQISDPNFGTAKVQPRGRVEAKVVGIVAFNTSVVQDDVDAHGSQFALMTPAFTNGAAACCGYGTFTGFQLDQRRNVSVVEDEIARTLPKGTAFYFHETSVVTAKAERAIKPQSLALGVFGAIAILAALLIAGQAIGRHLRLDPGEIATLRALGAGPATTATDGLAGVAGAALIGSVTAAAVGALLSPLAPIGPVRAVDRSPGFAFDWTVLGLGIVVLAAATIATAIVIAYRLAPISSRDGRGARRFVRPGSGRSPPHRGCPHLP